MSQPFEMKKFFRFIRIYTAVLLGAAAFCFYGCSPEEESVPEKKKQTAVFPPIPTRHLSLEIISTRTGFRRDLPNQTLRFAFRNNGASLIRVPEWKLYEQENIRLFYAECPLDGFASRIPASKWKEAERVSPSASGDGIPRYELMLAPKNSALLEIPMPFLKKLEQKGRYAVKGRLDLSSVPLESSPIEIVIQ